MKFNIRVATIGDSKFIRESQLAMAFETEKLRLDPALLQKGVDAVLENPLKGHYYIAVDPSGAPVACLFAMPEWSDWRNATVLWIHSLYVVPSARKHGVFKQMYAHLKSMVESSDDYRGLRLFVDKRNEPAKLAYLRVGMSADHYELFEWLK
ncbi:MAG: GNAT family N-acetyltransferase [Bdellovibrionales bacterium]|nr:GNAT family N-acetyltransferase [Bdellovibrionales bacterium]